MTELNDHLKLLFARAAQLFRPPDRPACAARLAEHLLKSSSAPWQTIRAWW